MVTCELKVCPACGGKIGVIDTRALEKEIVRIRLCRGCRRRLETVEAVARVVYAGEVRY
ncbi:NrdR family transcriptional regulator [Desulfovibrio sp. TomC]|uniref:NrdR family transcriptional regulator n=1 Tax=Desulfovibrio sp. TomC TaxID=1562888 RepID=UPI0005743D94|nr:hypothetical protein [Desulfovibrio sp. TomC]KHK02362.1 hypothetical protein NY78_2120 [Desulfovibrio sp. TomC]